MVIAMAVVLLLEGLVVSAAYLWLRPGAGAGPLQVETFPSLQTLERD